MASFDGMQSHTYKPTWPNITHSLINVFTHSYRFPIPRLPCSKCSKPSIYEMTVPEWMSEFMYVMRMFCSVYENNQFNYSINKTKHNTTSQSSAIHQYNRKMTIKYLCQYVNVLVSLFLYACMHLSHAHCSVEIIIPHSANSVHFYILPFSLSLFLCDCGCVCICFVETFQFRFLIETHVLW